MHFHSSKIIFSVLIFATFASCKKALEISPRQSIEASTALTTRDNVNAAITGVYSRLKSARLYGRDFIAIPEALSDNGFATNKSGRLINEANNVAGAHFTTTVYQSGYAAINEVNLILSKIADVADATAADRINWEGQLYFLRGLYYFDLVKIYAYVPGATVPSQDRGGIPIKLTFTDNIDSARAGLPTRASMDAVYAQIVADLQTSNSKFTTFTSSTDVSLANKGAVQALLSRVNLYRKDFSEAKRWSDSAISLAGSRLTSTATYVNNWRQATHGETLFQVRFGASSENIGVNESLQTSFTTLVSPGGTVTGGFGDLVPTLTLLTDLGITLTGGNASTANFALPATIATRSTDVRNQLYEVGTSGRGNRKVEVTKYIGKNGAINLDNAPVLRIAETYLNRAEAMATVGSPVFNATAALSDLNTILSNRGLPTVSLTGTALYDEIIRQRRIELSFEGHRFFDLKRLGRDLVKSPHYNNVAFTDFRILPAIPQREVDINPSGIRQNFGY